MDAQSATLGAQTPTMCSAECGSSLAHDFGAVIRTSTDSRGRWNAAGPAKTAQDASNTLNYMPYVMR